MLNRITLKAMRLARGTALALGTAVMAAVVLGIATTALAADGKPFLLGKPNVATAVSALIKKGAGPALSLKVGAGQPPLAVNATAGKATNFNADKIDGLDSTQFQRTVAQPGQVFSGLLATRYIPGNSHFAVAADSYPVPLPANTPTPSLEYVPGAPTADCPGVGQAAPGVLCIYGLSTHNIDRIGFGGNTGSGEISRLYGFVLDVYPSNDASSGFFTANWAYKVPPRAS